MSKVRLQMSSVKVGTNLRDLSGFVEARDEHELVVDRLAYSSRVNR